MVTLNECAFLAQKDSMPRISFWKVERAGKTTRFNFTELSENRLKMNYFALQCIYKGVAGMRL